MGKVKLLVSVLPKEMLVGISTSNGGAYCNECDNVHEFYAVQIGFLFVVFNFFYFY